MGLNDSKQVKPEAREAIAEEIKRSAIAAASIVAKVERDALMVRYAKQYPEYDLASCKGYVSPAHIAAIKAYGLTPTRPCPRVWA